jgi:hypothetical protein
MPGARDEWMLVLRVWAYAIVSAVTFTTNSRVSEHCNADYIQKHAHSSHVSFVRAFQHMLLNHVSRLHAIWFDSISTSSSWSH